MLLHQSPLTLREPGDDGVQPVTEDPIYKDPKILAEIDAIDASCSNLLTPKEMQYALFGGIDDETNIVEFMQAVDRR